MKPSEISIVHASAKDLNALLKIGISTFTESFASQNTAEDMAMYISETFNEETLFTELSNREIEYYFVYADKLAGYLKLNFGQHQKEFARNDTMEIERIYVKKEFQGKKIGQELLLKAISIAKSRNIKKVWLGVWERNEGAMRFYEKNGFKAFDKHIFKLGRDEQTDILMQLEF